MKRRIQVIQGRGGGERVQLPPSQTFFTGRNGEKKSEEENFSKYSFGISLNDRGKHRILVRGEGTKNKLTGSV